MPKTALARFKIIAFLEGSSFLVLLLLTMPLKYALDIHEPNKAMGIIHGLLFVWYVLVALQVKIEQSWPISKLFLALLSAVLPFGTFLFTARLKKDGSSIEEHYDRSI